MDYKKIKTEYLKSSLSIKELAKKYGCSKSTLQKVAWRENWSELRKTADKKAEAILVDTAAQQQAQRKKKFESAVDAILDDVTRLIKSKKYDRTPQNLYTLSGVLSRLKDCQLDANDKQAAEIRVMFEKNFDGLCE